MPSRTRPGKESFESGEDNGCSLELRRSPRRHHPSKTTKEKALSPRAHQRVKFKEKVQAETPIRPPHADIPFEFVKNGDSGTLVRTKPSGNHQQQQLLKNECKEDEIVKYMSHLPAYLQKGEKLQDTVLSFGVLDWERLEKWKHEQKQCSERDKARTTFTRSSSSVSTAGSSVYSSTVKSEALNHQRGEHSHHHFNTFHEVHTSMGDKLLNKKVRSQQISRNSFECKTDVRKRISKEDKSCNGDTLKMKFTSGKEKDSDKLKSLRASTKFSGEVSFSSTEKVGGVDGKSKTKLESFDGARSDPAHQHCPGKQERVILLLPKDFSRSGCVEVPERTSLDGKSAEFNWNSFSDVFSVAEVDSEESFSDVPHSCPLSYTIELETDLDTKLDELINSQKVEVSFNLPVTPHLDQKHHDVKREQTNAKGSSISTTCETSRGLDQNVDSLKTGKTIDLSATCHYGLGIERMNRSLSFREGTAIPPLHSTYITVKSGPAGPTAPATCANSNSKMTNASGRTRSSPLRRLLDPLLKPKVTKLFNSSENIQQCIQRLNDFGIIPLNADECQNDNRGATTVQAFLHLTINSGRPLFKFVVEAENEVLASTGKKFSTLEKDDSSWLYTLYSVQKVCRKGGRWRNQGTKCKSYELAYTAVGQMKVSNPHLPDLPNCEEKYIIKESVLYGVDLSTGIDDATSKSMGSKELAAIIIKMPSWRYRCAGRKFDKDGDLKDDAFSDCLLQDGYCIDPEEGGFSGSIVVILPSGSHSLPNEGGPSPLINRWRSGGSCDCGGWDVGCKLQILINDDEGYMTDQPSSTYLPDRCDLFLKGGAKERRPALSLVPYRNGIYSVEFDAAICKLQAFAICIAVINSHKHTDLLGADDCDEAKQNFQGGGPARYATFPPLSPVERV